MLIRRGSTESLRVYHSESDDFVMAAQVKVHAQDILLSVVDGDGGGELTESLRIAATDQWVELVLRFHSHGFAGRTVRILLDNSFSMVRAKQVQVRFLFTSVQAYNQAWLGCLEMAQSMTWKLAAETGQQRCDEFMASQSRIEEEAVMLQRESSGESIDDGSTVGFRSSLIDNPVSRLVGGLLTSDASAPTACWLCLTPFSFFSRQRSCPICQEVVCIPCSRHYMQVNGKESQLKVCDRCFVKEKDREVSTRRSRSVWLCDLRSKRLIAMRVVLASTSVKLGHQWRERSSRVCRAARRSNDGEVFQDAGVRCSAQRGRTEDYTR